MHFSGSPFLADSGGEELDDGLLGQMKASTAYLSHGKLQLLHNQLKILTDMGVCSLSLFPVLIKQLFHNDREPFTM